MRPDFHEPTLDPLFKHLMGHKAIRNSLLTAILNEEISDSELIDGSLNPFPAFKEIRSLINDSKIEILMQSIEAIPVQALRERQHQDLLHQALGFIRKLAPYYHDLSAAIPSAERQTRLDVVCKSSYGLINVEIQIAPQDYWDLRILDHVCGLFHRQFSRGFKWEEFETNAKVSEKIMRVVGVSLFVKPPIYPENVEALLPWYKVRAWEDNELKRHFRLCNQEKNPESFRPGIEFFDFNLEAFILLHAKHGLDAYPKVLCEWLDFFARAHTKTVADIEASDYSEPVKQAYELIKDLPPDLEEQYKESLIEREQISHYIQGTRALALAEGDRKVAKVKEEAEAREAQLRAEAASQLRAEKHRTAQSLLQRGLALDEIVIITGLSLAEIEGLQS